MGLATVILKSQTLENFVLKTSFSTALEVNLCTHHKQSATTMQLTPHPRQPPSPSFWKPVLSSPCVFVVISLVLAQGFGVFFKIPHMNKIIWYLSFPVLFHAEVSERSIHVVKNGRISFFLWLMIISSHEMRKGLKECEIVRSITYSNLKLGITQTSLSARMDRLHSVRR